MPLKFVHVWNTHWFWFHPHRPAQCEIHFYLKWNSACICEGGNSVFIEVLFRLSPLRASHPHQTELVRWKSLWMWTMVASHEQPFWSTCKGRNNFTPRSHCFKSQSTQFSLYWYETLYFSVTRTHLSQSAPTTPQSHIPEHRNSVPYYTRPRSCHLCFTYHSTTCFLFEITSTRQNEPGAHVSVESGTTITTTIPTGGFFKTIKSKARLILLTKTLDLPWNEGNLIVEKQTHRWREKQNPWGGTRFYRSHVRLVPFDLLVLFTMNEARVMWTIGRTQNP